MALCRHCQWVALAERAKQLANRAYIEDPVGVVSLRDGDGQGVATGHRPRSERGLCQWAAFVDAERTACGVLPVQA